MFFYNYVLHYNLHAACAPSSSFESFPKNVSGVMAFSASRYALPAYYYQSWIKTSLALCLPSTTLSPGVLFFGEGPFYLLPHSDVDLRSLLSYTPLLKRSDSFSYYIGVNAIIKHIKHIQTLLVTTLVSMPLLNTDLSRSWRIQLPGLVQLSLTPCLKQTFVIGWFGGCQKLQNDCLLQPQLHHLAFVTGCSSTMEPELI